MMVLMLKKRRRSYIERRAYTYIPSVHLPALYEAVVIIKAMWQCRCYVGERAVADRELVKASFHYMYLFSYILSDDPCESRRSQP